MKNLLIMGVTFLFTAVLACLPLLTLGGEEPVYQGKPLSLWIDETTDPAPEVRRHAVFALGEMRAEAKEAIPALIVATKDGDSGVRALSVKALSLIDPKAKDVLPAISQVILDSNTFVSREAIRAVQRCSRPQAPIPQ